MISFDLSISKNKFNKSAFSLVHDIGYVLAQLFWGQHIKYKPLLLVYGWYVPYARDAIEKKVIRSAETKLFETDKKENVTILESFNVSMCQSRSVEMIWDLFLDFFYIIYVGFEIV